MSAPDAEGIILEWGTAHTLHDGRTPPTGDRILHCHPLPPHADSLSRPLLPSQDEDTSLYSLSRTCPLLASALLLAGCGSVPSLGSLWPGSATDDLAGEPQAPRVEVSIVGVADELAHNVRAFLGLADETCDAPEWRVQRQFARSDDDVQRALRAFGHYEPAVQKNLQRVPDCWRADYVIDAGPRVRIRAVDVNVTGPAREDARFVALLADLPLKAREPLNHARYESLKNTIESLAAERGYFAGRFTRSELRVDTAELVADVVLAFESGPRHVLGAVSVEQTAFDDDLIERFITLVPGESYDSTRIALQNRELSDSGYFDTVDVRPKLAATRAASGTDPAPEIPVEIILTPRPQHSYTAGLGYATDSGPRMRLGYENRRLNRRGHRWQADTSVATSAQEVSLGYSIPLADPRTEWLGFNAGYKLTDTKTSESSTARVSVNRTGTRFGDWLETQRLDITHDSFDVGSIDDTTLLVVPGISWQRTDGDDPLRPTRGWSLLVELRGTHEALLSDTSFVQARTRAHGVYTLPWDGRLLARAEIGTTAVTDFDVLPPAYRFFAGGDNSIRGYRFEELGPTDDSGLVVGGRYLGVASLEYEHPIAERWSVATFVDAGNAFDDFDEGVKVGVGGGVRWQSPVGPLRADLGLPLNADDDTLFQFHLRFGPDL